MQTDFIAVPPLWTVGQAIDYMRESDDLPDEFYQLFVVDPGHRLVGTVALDRLLRSKRPTPISAITDTNPHPVRATQDQEDVARLFERYNLLSAPVVDEGDRLVGVITVDDVVDVIEEEADEDIRRLAGVGDEEALRHRPLCRTEPHPLAVHQHRHGVPGGRRDQPVRHHDRADGGARGAHADRRLDGRQCRHAGDDRHGARHRHARDRHPAGAPRRRPRGAGRPHQRLRGRRLCRAWAAGLWFGNVSIGVVISIALIVNIFVAGVVGSLIPLLFERLKIDPAVASGVILTAVTDMTGFFVFLSLAGWWFGLI